MWEIVVPVMISLVSAIAAVGAATIAAKSARQTKTMELEIQRLRELEARISEKKFDMYKPMIETLRDMLDKEKSKEMLIDERAVKVFQARMADFAIWIAIYGSDEAILQFRNFTQCTYSSAPAPILLRLYAQFLIAARRDMGYSETAVTPVDLLGIRIKDLYGGQLYEALTEPFEVVCRKHDWRPPWL